MNYISKQNHVKIKEYLEQELVNLANHFTNPHDTNRIGTVLDGSTKRIMGYINRVVNNQNKQTDKLPPIPRLFKVLADGEWVKPSKEFKDIIDNIEKGLKSKVEDK